MTVTSQVVVQAAVDAYDLFTAARTIVGLPPPHRGWHLTDYGDVHVLQTLPGQGATARVSVHFAPDAGPYPNDEDTDQPTGYALVGFDTDGTDRDTVRARHAQLIAGLGTWLTQHDLDWCWQYEDELWVLGHHHDDQPTNNATGSTRAADPQPRRRDLLDDDGPEAW